MSTVKELIFLIRWLSLGVAEANNIRSKGHLAPFGLPPIGQLKQNHRRLHILPSTSKTPSLSLSSSSRSSSAASNPTSSIQQHLSKGMEIALPLPRNSPSDDTYMQFTAKIWEFVSVYPDKKGDTENRRFWIAQLASDVPENCEAEAMIGIFYYQNDNKDYTVFSKENGKRILVQVPYKSLTSRVNVTSNDEETGVITISKEERDRLTERGRILDHMKPTRNTSSQLSRKRKR